MVLQFLWWVFCAALPYSRPLQSFKHAQIESQEATRLAQVGYLGSGLLFAILLVIQISPAACAVFLPELAPYLHGVTWLNRLKDTSSIQHCSSMIA